jgi:hypothetical protein
MALKPVARAAHALARPVFKRFGISEGAIAENWAEIVGAEWARWASPRHFNRQSQTLTLRLAGAHALELAHLEREMIARINGFAGRDLVKRLKLVQGPVSSARARSLLSSPVHGGEPAPDAIRGPPEAGRGERRASPLRPCGAPPPQAGEDGDKRRGIIDPGLAVALAALGRAIRAKVPP